MANTSTDTAAAVPTEAALRALCAREHHASFACRSVAAGGLGLTFTLQADGSVSANWTCPPGGESYAGIVHGGLLATALDSAMVHALFARGIVARTGELNVRYRQSVRAGAPVTVTARHHSAYHPLHRLVAEIHQFGTLCAQASGKFMAVEHPTPTHLPLGSVQTPIAHCATPVGGAGFMPASSIRNYPAGVKPTPPSDRGAGPTCRAQLTP